MRRRKRMLEDLGQDIDHAFGGLLVADGKVRAVGCRGDGHRKAGRTGTQIAAPPLAGNPPPQQATGGGHVPCSR